MIKSGLVDDAVALHGEWASRNLWTLRSVS